MVNNQEAYCNYCRRKTLFFLESDGVWYCDECEKPMGSVLNRYEEFYDHNLHVVRCPLCSNLVSLNELVDAQYCPVCYEDLTEQFDEEECEEDEN